MVTFIYCEFIAYFGRAGDFSRQFYLTNSTSWIAVEVNNRQHCREKKCQLTKNLVFATTRNYSETEFSITSSGSKFEPFVDALKYFLRNISIKVQNSSRQATGVQAITAPFM